MTRKDVLKEARQSLLSSGLLAPRIGGLPEQIERSWRRSISQGISPELTDLVQPSSRAVDERLLAAARPVLLRLAEQVADMQVGAVLSDAEGVIIERVVLDSAQRTRLDRAGALVGSSFAEHSVGTNGLGSVLEERAPLFVRGAEHFIDALEDIACAGVPIFDPSTKRLRGSLSLTCAAVQANPLMLTLAHTAARDIEQRLLDGRSRGLLDIASAFARATTRHSGAFAMLTPSTVLANTAGLPYVSPANHAMIWDRLVKAEVADGSLLRVELTDGAVDLRAQRIQVTDEALAFQVAFTPVRSRPASSSSDAVGDPATAIGSAWHPLANVDLELRSIQLSSPVVAILGGAGTGKTFAGRRMLRDPRAPFTEVDPVGQAVPWAPSWAGTVRHALAAGRHVLLRHVEALPAAQLPLLRSVLIGATDNDDHPRSATRLVLTMDRAQASQALLSLVDGAASIVELPSLDQMRSRIPLLVQRMIDEYPVGQRCIVSPAAMRVLMSRDWPANISELRRVVHDLVAKHPGDVVQQSDVPGSGGDVVGRVLTPLERSEREVIVAALRESQGNRAAAARILGIGRTTLYRKLRALRIEDGCLP